MAVSVRFLLDHGAKPDIRDASGVSPLFEAVRSGHAKCAELLGKAGGTLQVPSSSDAAGGGLAAAASGQLNAGQLVAQARCRCSLVWSAFGVFVCVSRETLRVRPLGLLSVLFNLPSQWARSETLGWLLANAKLITPELIPFPSAIRLPAYPPQVCAAGDARLLQGLLSNGLNPSEADMDGRTGLHVAAERGGHLLTKVLLQAGADPSARDSHGFTPLLEAVRRGHVSVAREIFEAGGRLGLHDEDPAAATRSDPLDTPWGDQSRVGLLTTINELSAAVQRGQLEYLRLLLNYGASVDAADPFDGRTAAHVACMGGLVDAAIILHGHGADFEGPDRWGRTPMDMVRTGLAAHAQARRPSMLQSAQ